MELDNIFSSKGKHMSLSFYTNEKKPKLNQLSANPYQNFQQRSVEAPEQLDKITKDFQRSEINNIRKTLKSNTKNSICSARTLERAILLPDNLNSYSPLKAYPRPHLLSNPFKSPSQSKKCKRK